MIYDGSVKEDLFIKGVVAFNSQDFYNAHEYWEEIWSDYKLSEPDIIQGMIQFAVGLFSKSVKKLTPYIDSNILKIDINNIVQNSRDAINLIHNGYEIKSFTIKLI